MEINHQHDYSIAEVIRALNSGEPLALAEHTKAHIQKGREFLESFVARADAPIYGINTGFGSLCDVEIEDDQLSQLQTNLVVSHACGTGECVPVPIVKLMLLLKIMGLSKGKSGVRLVCVEQLMAMYNQNIIPVVYQQGSLGASGDLAPLAHLALPMLGMGEVWQDGKKVNSASALKSAGMEPMTLKSKEGLALLNGTQFMSAYATYMLGELQKWIPKVHQVAALSLDAFDGRIDPFHEGIHQARPHHGQIRVAKVMRDLLNGSPWIQQAKAHVQDPYSFRCIPQVHGASLDAIDHITRVVEIEINAVTDNPTVLPKHDAIVSAGNFHGQPLAINLDYLCIAMAELASISERRTYKLISGQRGLPPYLVAAPGINSGFMIAQYTAASIVSQNKQLCAPASVDTIDSSNGQEDHVSMGANAATKAHRVLENLKQVVAIEAMTAAQAADFREGKSSPKLEEWRSSFRKDIPFIEQDEVMYLHLQKAKQILEDA